MNDNLIDDDNGDIFREILNDNTFNEEYNQQLQEEQQEHQREIYQEILEKQQNEINQELERLQNESFTSAIVSPYWAEKIKSYKRDVYVCYNCKLKYTESENIGKWKCHQHATFASINEKVIWPCCGRTIKSINNNGCVKSDHTTLTVPYGEYDNLPIPISIAPQLKINNKLPSVVEVNSPDNYEFYTTREDIADATENYIQIRRYDLKQQKINGF